MRGWTGGEPPLDPPDDPPLVTCPDCEGEGRVEVEVERLPDGEAEVSIIDCVPCNGEGERYLTDEEVRDAKAEAEIERAEARRDGDL